jgi:hypothetical protein
MMLVENELKDRAKDVRSFLKSLSDIEKRLSLGERPFRGSKAMLPASKAASFIMMYNCVELAIADCLEEARDNIESSGKNFEEIKPHWQREIIRSTFKSKLENGCNFDDLLEDFRKCVPMKVKWGSHKSKLPFAGNINHEKIHDLAKKIGGNWRPPKAAQGGADLEIICRVRNQLAHGEESFENIGNQYTTSDLEKKFDRSYKFLVAFVRYIEKYISRAEYC